MPESSQYKQEFRSLGPGNLQASPGDHTHDGITSKTFPWVPFTTTWTATTTNPAIGNGSISSVYCLLGSLVEFRIVINYGTSTTVGSGTYRLTLPFVPSAVLPDLSTLGGNASILFATGSTFNIFFPVLLTASTSTMELRNVSGSVWTNSYPFTITSTGKVVITGRYEKA